jgi:hypothetical protein
MLAGAVVVYTLVEPPVLVGWVGEERAARQGLLELLELQTLAVAQVVQHTP